MVVAIYMEFTEGNDGWDLGRKQKLTVGKMSLRI